MHARNSLWRSVTLSLLLLIVCAGCSDQSNTSSQSEPAPSPPTNDTPAQTVTTSPTSDDFGIPSDFKPLYKLLSDENIDMSPTWTRRNVRIVVPSGLSSNDVEANTRAAAKAAYNKDDHPNAITVFAYKPNTDPHSVYTAGRLVWAPGGDWMRAGESVSVAEHKGVFDLSEWYSDAPNGLAAKMKRAEAKEDAAGRDEEAPLLRHYSERRLKTMYYAIQKGINDQIVSPVVPGDVDASFKVNKTAVCKKFHITSDQYEAIRDVGTERNWPEPE